MTTEDLRLPEQSTLDDSLRERYTGFPEGLTYEDFSRLTPESRELVLLRAPLIQTDAYNRTMDKIRGSDWGTPATYELAMRRSREGYLVVAGVTDLAHALASVRITEQQVDFARDYYRHVKGINYFNEDKWKWMLREYGGRLPITVECVPEGTAILPGDPALRVSGPDEIVAHFEPFVHRLFYQTRVATNAAHITSVIGADRFIEVGFRASETAEKHLMALKAMYIGGGIRRTSNDMAAGLYPDIFQLVGTIGHRFIQSFDSEEEAFRRAIEALDTVTLLVDTYDTRRGIETVLRLKKEYRHTGKKIYIRLDSGNVQSFAVHSLKR